MFGEFPHHSVRRSTRKKGKRYGAFSGHVRIHGDVPAAYEDIYSGGYGSALPASMMASIPLLG